MPAIAEPAKSSPVAPEPDNARKPSPLEGARKPATDAPVAGKASSTTPAVRTEPGTAAAIGPPSREARSYDPSAAARVGVAARSFNIAIFSRDKPVSNGAGFSASDPKLGELAQGDLKARVQYDGVKALRGKLVLEWSLNGIPMDRKTVSPDQLVEYGNEPTAGNYVVTLLVDDHPVQSFAFRIAP